MIPSKGLEIAFPKTWGPAIEKTVLMTPCEDEDEHPSVGGKVTNDL
jgi:hypothetical protein